MGGVQSGGSSGGEYSQPTKHAKLNAEDEESNALEKIVVDMYKRPTEQKVRKIWEKYADEHDEMQWNRSAAFLKEVFHGWGSTKSENDIREVFQLLDKDKSGGLDWQEFRHVFVCRYRGLHQLTIQKFREEFQLHDKAWSGEIYYKEAIRLAESLLRDNKLHPVEEAAALKQVAERFKRHPTKHITFDNFTKLFGPVYYEFCDLTQRHEYIPRGKLSSSSSARVCRSCTSLASGATYGGFAKERDNINVRFLVNGREAFDAMAYAIEKSLKSIYISACWITETTFMRRHNGERHIQNRLDQLLKARARAGVRVYVLLRDDVGVEEENQSAAVQVRLEKLDQHIKVVRHPKFFPFAFSHHQKFLVADNHTAIVGGLDPCIGRWDDDNHRVTDSRSRYWPGIDYYQPNDEIPGFREMLQPNTDCVNRRKVPRLPWHGVSVLIDGRAAYDVAQNFSQRWNHHHEDLSLDAAQYPKCSPVPNQVPPPEQKHQSSKSTPCRVQVVRSLGTWSGLRSGSLDTSLLDAYRKVISNAKHYLYLEHEVIVSSAGMPNKVQNNVVSLIVDRILHSIREPGLAKHPFRVFILLPPPDDNSVEENHVWKLTMNTLVHGQMSIRKRVQRAIASAKASNAKGVKDKWTDYVSIAYLRNHGEQDKVRVTSGVFVQSGLLIADDRVAIVSSAHINDRSLLGDRDSELGVVITDTQMVPSTMAGASYSAGKSVRQLRMRLWNSYLGRHKTDDRVEDPVHDDVYYGHWLATAIANANVYERVFPYVPSDPIHTREQLKFRARKPNNTDELKKVHGILCVYPTEFFSAEKLFVTPQYLREMLLTPEDFY
eukprot:TRINITY_DN66477_c8_g2_i2.p1 TRINITY_DN66477_c8_g2~~TRINITY_DN66477_c8_g2_i2.p1  ORF type:complete len:830 (-),score=469.87 TRINITY_DN66477_c8_g2_i2:1199-3688(-)